MPNWCMNKLSVYGKPDEIMRFKDGLQKIDDEYKILESYIPIPKELEETEVSVIGEIAYDTIFNPVPDAHLQTLKLVWIKEHGIETKEQLIEILKKEHPESIQLGSKYQENASKYGYIHWEDFVRQNWGTTKIDFHTTLSKQNSGMLRFQFKSAWSPPLNGLDRIAIIFPELIFRLEFNEPGMGLKGIIRWANGERVECADNTGR